MQVANSWSAGSQRWSDHRTVDGPPKRSHHHHHGVLDQGLERAAELRTERTVDRPVIGGEPDRHDMRGLDLAIAHDRALLAGADRENGRVGWIDDGVEFLDAVHPEIGDRAAPALI